jgi:hypothetical protein
LPWNCRLLALELLLGRLSLSFPFILFPFRFSFFIPRSVVGTWGAPSVFLLFRPCLRAFGPSLLVLCFLAGVPLFHRRPSAFVGFLVGFLVGFRRCLSAFFGFVGVIPLVCVFWPVFRASWPVFCCFCRRPSAFLGVIRLGISVSFGSAFRCFLAGDLGISARCSAFLLGFCCSFFKAGFLSVGFPPAPVGIPPVFR